MQFTGTAHTYSIQLQDIGCMCQTNRGKITKPPYPINDITFTQTLCTATHLKSIADLSLSENKCNSNIGHEGARAGQEGTKSSPTAFGPCLQGRVSPAVQTNEAKLTQPRKRGKAKTNLVYIN